MGVSQNQGPQHRPLNIGALIVRIPAERTPSLWKQPRCSMKAATLLPIPTDRVLITAMGQKVLTSRSCSSFMYYSGRVLQQATARSSVRRKPLALESGCCLACLCVGTHAVCWVLTYEFLCGSALVCESVISVIFR